jgi:acyl-CoA reductase-like NAD-dependent aldehyde dehydrogenase
MSETTSPFPMTSPRDGAKLDAVKSTAPEAIAEMVKTARTAQRAWGRLTPEERAEKVLAVKDRILDRAEKIAKLCEREVGKPFAEGVLSEVLPSADVVSYWCTSIAEHMEPVDVDLDPLTYAGKSGVVQREARGVVAVIMPWNYPVALPLRTLIPALLAGNAVLFKPSEVSARCGALVAELFDGLLPEGVLQLVQGGGDVGGALTSADVDLVVFTGSVRTGKRVAAACAERLVPCSLELGGKDAAIVLADANLERAANGIVWGAFTNAGQNCASIERVYVVKAIADEFIKKVVETAKALGEGEVGPLTTEAQRKIVEEHVAGAKEAGGKILVGGERGEKGYAFAPTVVRLEKDDVALMQDETFGPVLPIRVVDDAAEAIELANASRYGLTASLWTKDVDKAEELARDLRAGVVTINNHAFTGALPAAPWSGHGETGYGITNSPLALDMLTRPRFVLADRSSAKREMWWYPYTPALRTIALSLAKIRSGTTSIFAKIGAVFTLLGAFPKRFSAKS